MFLRLEAEMSRILQMTDDEILARFRSYSAFELSSALAEVSMPLVLGKLAQRIAEALELDLEGNRQRFVRLLNTALAES